MSLIRRKSEWFIWKKILYIKPLVRKEFRLRFNQFNRLLIIFFIVFFGLILSILLYMITFIFRLKLKSKNKINRFESGFVQIKGIRFSFSIHFFIVLLIFIIFDI